MIAVLPSRRRDQVGQIAKSLPRASLLVAVLALVVAGLWCTRHRWFLTSTERKLVGSWVWAESPTTTRVFTFAADRRVTARNVDRSGATVGEILGDEHEIWFVDGQTLFIRRGTRGFRSVFDLIPGHNRIWERWPIRSLTEDTLVLGDESWGKPFVLKRDIAR